MRRPVSRVAVAVALVLALGIAAVLLLNRGQEAPVTSGEEPSAQKPAKRLERPRDSTPFDYEDPGIELPEGSTTVAPHFDLANLDLAALRARTPDNLYWLLAAPTEDPAVLEARAAEKKRRNDQYGRVLSSTATTDEIEDYYAYRRRLSEDYIEVSQLILDDHGDALAERDVGLLELTIALHTSRLSEVPRKLDDALRRKSEYEAVKRAWQAQQEAEREALGADTTASPN